MKNNNLVLKDTSESRSSEDGKGAGEARGSLGLSFPMGGILGEVQDTDILGDGDR